MCVGKAEKRQIRPGACNGISCDGMENIEKKKELSKTKS